MVNQAIVNRLLNNIDSYVRQLEDAADIGYQDYDQDIRFQRFVERTLQISIEACLDIAHHIISDERYREPSTYADAFAVLNENEVISSALAEKGKRISQFRNKLTHFYDKIDQFQVYDIFQNHLSDFSDFRQEIDMWLKRQ